MTDELRCPMCGSLNLPGPDDGRRLEFRCGSTAHDHRAWPDTPFGDGFRQSKDCRILELESEVSRLRCRIACEDVCSREREAAAHRTAKNLLQQDAELIAENATLHEICRLWERLIGDTMYFFMFRDDGEHYLISQARPGDWAIHSSVACFGNDLFDSPLAALAAVEAWEAKQKEVNT